MSGRKNGPGLSRRQFLEGLAMAGGGLALAQALELVGATSAHAQESRPYAPGQLTVPEGCGRGRKVVILGAGISGLATAYELLAPGCDFKVTVLEANNRVGGRSHTVRAGDLVIEDKYAPQKCTFQSEPGQAYEPYLNAGPGRIPSAHIHLLHYCKQLAVDLEVYVMQSRSNLMFAQGGFGDRAMVDRHVAYDVRGYLAEYLYNLASSVVAEDQVEALHSLLVTFGMLDDHGRYVIDDENGKRVYANFGLANDDLARPGYKRLPGVSEGEPVDPLDFNEVLASGFWEKTRFYQPEDFLWQQTSFQPVGGMDRIVKAFAREVEARGGIVRLQSPVRRITKDSDGKFVIDYETTSGEVRTETADICVSNVPIPLLQGRVDLGMFNEAYRTALEAVFHTEGFLDPTCKVGWQAKRDLWQSHKPPERVVPIYGGISWTSESITQIWYPSCEYHADLGVLTGAYNFSDNAIEYGDHDPQWRLERARREAANLGGQDFADGLGHGLTVAWQNVPYQKGGWANWAEVKKKYPDAETYMNTLLEGDNDFFICGDQLSVLPGWQEGAIAVAQHVVRSIFDEGYKHVPIRRVPDPRVLVEGRVGPRGSRLLRQKQKEQQ